MTEPGPSTRFVIETTIGRVEGTLGTVVRCGDHGLVGWVRTSLTNSLIGAHTAQHHTLHKGGMSDRTMVIER